MWLVPLLLLSTALQYSLCLRKTKTAEKRIWEMPYSLSMQCWDCVLRASHPGSPYFIVVADSKRFAKILWVRSLVAKVWSMTGLPLSLVLEPSKPLLDPGLVSMKMMFQCHIPRPQRFWFRIFSGSLKKYMYKCGTNMYTEIHMFIITPGMPWNHQNCFLCFLNRAKQSSTV